MATRMVKAISPNEFAQMMQVARPPVGWSNTIAAANSGGPDSTCLLFLLNQYIKGRGKIEEKHRKDDKLSRIVSLTVDHGLQESSSAMAEQAATLAESIGVEHITTKLPWGRTNYPPKPGPDEKIEEVARDMRQRVLFGHMKDLNANSLALGHHADDQVETMLMRLGRGSTQFGLSGMRPCRRWGMGSGTPEDDAAYGIHGLRKWIVRPLLGVGKDRIIKTCEDNKLEYVTDSTNFQPQLTIRNAIRHVIHTGGATALTANDPEFEKFPADIAQQLADINVAAAREPSYGFNLASDLCQLREASMRLSSSMVKVDKAVDDFIAKYRLSSPPGTLRLPVLPLQEIESQLVREALLYRVARFVSPEPWGSPRAELGRRKSSMNRLMAAVWNMAAIRTKASCSITVGSGIWWRLVAFGKNQLRTSVDNFGVKDLGWVALRQPTAKSDPGREVFRPLKHNVTQQLLQMRQEWLSNQKADTFEILFDRRFLISFRVDKIPKQILEMLSSNSSFRFCRERLGFCLKLFTIIKEKIIQSIKLSYDKSTFGTENTALKYPKILPRIGFLLSRSGQSLLFEQGMKPYPRTPLLVKLKPFVFFIRCNASSLMLRIFPTVNPMGLKGRLQC
ncbi:hypothetical protein M413DRAFT_86579 [Hebeloma cylindrosporum]|uniref:tRNA(Ile)-lysidine synthetase n=1 Tax=Hebeloma cylindrosporum TaxID=76867 RepID=A0A0C2YGG5_HEBCY|nr:hypothetical protein M413DRAFT_86579 [Hebeloma cylindrosporum h7]